MKRGIKEIEDIGTIENVQYNSESGGQKNLTVGPALKYVSVTTASVRVKEGDQLYFFKTTTGLGYVTFGETGTITVGTAPASDTFPVFGQQYTPIASDKDQYVKGSADIHLYVLKDDNQKRINP